MSKAAAKLHDERVLILAPTGRDAAMTSKFLDAAGMTPEVCAGMEELCSLLLQDSGAALIAEEALTREGLRCLLGALAAQAPWSDFPLVVLTNGGGDFTDDLGALRALGEAGNMTLVERPTRVITILSAVRSALRARRRQYEVRAHLEREQRAREERTRLLEEAIASREQAESANRAKDIFLATLSHELRTPLTAVLGWTRMLREMKLDDETARHGLLVIERNAESQHQLIRDLLDVSRIISGKLRLETDWVQLAPVVEAAVDSVRQAADAKDIRLDVTLDAGSELVSGDEDRLQQVVWNLLSNAIKFTPKGGRVGVRLERAGSDIRIKVSDTGQGIAADFLPHVFERFQQADGSTTRTHGGLGLGLAVVRHLVEQHGGQVSAESAGVGRGASFTVTLPLAAVRPSSVKDRDEDARIAVSAQSDEAKPLAGVRVLVVDDQEDAREMLAMVLQHAGALVTTAGSAAEALKICGDEKIDVLVSDIGMPEEDGYTLIGRVRSLPSNGGGRTPAIALTAYATEEDQKRALAEGFEAHVAKPVEPSELVTVVSNIAGAARTRTRRRKPAAARRHVGRQSR